MKILDATNIPAVTGQDQYHWYNGSDSLITRELLDTLQPQLKPGTTGDIYGFSRKLLGPVMTMMRRGTLLDQKARVEAVEGNPESDDWKLKLGLKGRVYRLGGMTRIEKSGKGQWIVTDEAAIIQRFAKAVWGRTLNYHSDFQLKAFFYTALAIPPVIKAKKGERKITLDRDALEKIAKNYMRAQPIANALLTLRDLEKQQDVLAKRVDPDGRWRSSFNIGGTETGRFSSSASPYRTGSNSQNLDPTLRHIFIPDPGKVFVYADLKGAESVGVAYLSEDEKYIEAVNSQDVHTMVASWVWGIPNEREYADKPYYRHYSYRDLAKKCGHACNYLVTPRTMAVQQHIEIKVAEEFQHKYFKAFPGIREWQHSTARELQTTGCLTNPFGRRRQFWGRLRDDATLREGVAFKPQSTIADVLDTGMYLVWYHLEPQVQLLKQIHDAILCQMDEEKLATLLPSMLQYMKVEVPVGDHLMVIPVEAEVGRNWGKFHPEKNPTGMRAFDKWHH